MCATYVISQQQREDNNDVRRSMATTTTTESNSTMSHFLVYTTQSTCAQLYSTRRRHTIFTNLELGLLCASTNEMTVSEKHKQKRCFI